MIINKFISSPNYNERRVDTIDMIILHYTDTIDSRDSIDIMTHPDREVSAHYLIDENGDIIQLVEKANRAWHAGQSFWRGITDINSHSIGIEIQNPGHGHGYREFPEEQMDSVLILCQDLVSQYDIPAHNILAHSDIAPARKKDPGELFDWNFLAENGVGIYPKPVANLNGGQSLDALLISYGYDPSVTEIERLTAFKRHFGWNDDENALLQKALFLNQA